MPREDSSLTPPWLLDLPLRTLLPPLSICNPNPISTSTSSSNFDIDVRMNDMDHIERNMKVQGNIDDTAELLGKLTLANAIIKEVKEAYALSTGELRERLRAAMKDNAILRAEVERGALLQPEENDATAAKDPEIARMEAQIVEMDAKIADFKKKMQEKDLQMSDMSAQLADKDIQLAEKDTQLEDKDTRIVHLQKDNSRQKGRDLAAQRRHQEKMARIQSGKFANAEGA
ncbi:hypothetical protein K491DRAFT_683693 [Lophiostoma macrostomum CBS 122681]|uniref:Uncharacterized protein n=1 Tax=Lophiostoma macrostomum CBS 122681 TaxID=1314788 RepID=A0A6A6SPQ7_9PLEO|nr:hypothetical protein K491DRAFT_683693 [Lophiostoma macrostomum CBS 122681]